MEDQNKWKLVKKSLILCQYCWHIWIGENKIEDVCKNCGGIGLPTDM